MRRVVWVVPILFALGTAAGAHDCGQAVRPCRPLPCARPTPCAQPCVQTVERTVLVPQWVTETRKVRCIEYKQQVQERKVTVWERVPVKRQVTCQYTEWVRETRTCKQQYTVCEPVWKEVEQVCTKWVTETVEKKGTRKVWKCVPVKKKVKVCEDQGHWEERQVCTCQCGRCGGCNPCGDPCATCCRKKCYTQRVWVPKIVEREVEVTVMQWQCVEEPYTYKQTVCRPVQEKRKVKVCVYKPVTKTREVKYTVCVPRTRTKTHEVTEYKCVPRQKTVKCVVLVPQEVEREIQVRVCKMVPKKIQCQVRVCPQPCPAPCCDP